MVDVQNGPAHTLLALTQGRAQCEKEHPPLMKKEMKIWQTIRI